MAGNQQEIQQFCTAKYTMLSALTVLVWDWILSSQEEFRVVRRWGLCVAVVVYYLARFCALNLCILTIIFLTGLPISDNCETAFAVANAMAIVAGGAKSFLFFLRVRAVYGKSRLVTFCFGAGWLAVVTTRTMVPLFYRAFVSQWAVLSDKKACSSNATGPWTLTTLWVNLAYDTAVFISISARLASYTNLTTKHRIRTFLHGEGLSRLVHTLLRGGQLFYFTTVGISLLVSIMCYAPVSFIYKTIWSLPALIIEVIVACKVFRAAMLETAEASDSKKEAALPGGHCTTAVTESGTIIELGTWSCSFRDEPY